MTARRRWAVPVAWASILMLILAACGSSQSQVEFVPVGAVDGRNTFLFLYTDN